MQVMISKVSKNMICMLTPRRSDGDDVSWDRRGPKLWAIGTMTGENKGMAELASCKTKPKEEY